MLIEIILGEIGRLPGDKQEPIQYSVMNHLFCANINGEIVSEDASLLRDRFAKLKARDALLGAVLARLGADPGARESEAHNAVGRLLNFQTALEKLAEGLGLKMDEPQVLVMQILAMRDELTSALARANEGERIHAAALRHRAELAEAEVTKIRAELEASAKALEAANAKRERDFNAAREAQREIERLKSRLAETDLDRVLAEARVDGLGAELKALEHALRSRLPVPQP